MLTSYSEFQGGNSMDMVRGAVGLGGLIVIALALAASQVHVLAQRDPEVRIVGERGKENRDRIVHLENTNNLLSNRLTRIETELELTRRTSESNGQLISGLAVGIGLMLFERILVLFGWIKRASKGGDND